MNEESGLYPPTATEPYGAHSRSVINLKSMRGQSPIVWRPARRAIAQHFAAPISTTDGRDAVASTRLGAPAARPYNESVRTFRSRCVE
jgi:hypothetical protein